MPLRQRAAQEHPPRKPGLYGWYRPGFYFSCVFMGLKPTQKNAVTARLKSVPGYEL
jgi:hypothetical protein